MTHSIQPGNGMLKKYLIRNLQSNLPSTFSYLFFKSFSAQTSPTLHLIRYFREEPFLDYYAPNLLLKES